jgi:integrase
MEVPMKKPGFRIRPFMARERGIERERFQVVGYLGNERIRKRFATREEAVGEKIRLEVQAANLGEIRAINTRMTPEQVAEAEAAFRRINGKPLGEVVDWYLANFRPPCVTKPAKDAVKAYVAARRGEVERVHLDDVERKLDILLGWFPDAAVHEMKADQIDAKMRARDWAAKTWNNVRGCFNAFFDFCCDDVRRWASENPMAKIAQRKVARGLPQIETAAKIKELFAYLETYTGGTRRPHQPGFLVPYFALGTFAGLRPSIPDGEIWKIGQLPDLSRTVHTEVGAIKLSPEIAKTDSVRQVKIRPTLAAWLAKYPLTKYPICVRNMQALVTEVRKKFDLSDDVLRHTWISAHVATFKSIGEAAIEAGNSESIIRIHYLNIMSEAEAAAFWAVVPALSNHVQP